MNQLPRGGGAQQSTVSTQIQSSGRVVNRTRLEKLNDELLTRKIDGVKPKVARKEESAQKKIAAIKQKVADYARFKDEESKVAKEILEGRKRTPPAVTSPKEKAA